MGADNDAVGLHEVLDRVALAQELRVGGDREQVRRDMLPDDRSDLAAGADRYGRLSHEDRELTRARWRRRDGLRRLLDRRVDVAEICPAIPVRGCPYRD